jgi:hypothetical protein
MQLLLPSRITKRIRRELKRAGTQEIGGLLMGEHVRADAFRVVDISVQRTGGSSASFVRDPASHDAQLKAFFARTGADFMLLDAVLAEPQLRWLGTEREKVEYFGRATPLKANELPSITFGRPPRQTVRYFPDKLPIGLSGDGRTHVFLYLVNRDAPVDLRAFLHRHAELLRALPGWELRLLVPRHLNEAAPAFEAAARQELAMPLRLGDVEELGWYFRQRRKVDSGGAAEDPGRFQRAVRQFHAPRFRALYRLWRREGDTLVYATVSRILGDALTRRTGQIRSHVLPHSYQHLTPLVGSA